MAKKANYKLILTVCFATHMRESYWVASPEDVKINTVHGRTVLIFNNLNISDTQYSRVTCYLGAADSFFFEFIRY